MKYQLVLIMRDKHLNILRQSAMLTLDTETDMTCDVGICINPGEAELMAHATDISVSIREIPDERKD